MSKCVLQVGIQEKPFPLTKVCLCRAGPPVVADAILSSAQHRPRPRMCTELRSRRPGLGAEQVAVTETSLARLPRQFIL